MAVLSEDASRLAARLQSFADTELEGYSPLYERIVRGLAADDALLERLSLLGGANRVPGLVLAAVHDIVIEEPDLELAAIYRGEPGDPWPVFTELLEERFDQVAEMITTRSIQTNEVGRCTALVPAIAEVASRIGNGRRLALVDIGSSAGLNLLLDRYSYLYRSPKGLYRSPTGRDQEAPGEVLASWGDPESPVHLTCTVIGELPPLPIGPLPLASRSGIDLEPIDSGDDEAARWLQACLWPDVPHRAERLRGAISVARTFPPSLQQGDLLEVLMPLLRELPEEVVPCIVSTWALAYLSADGRRELHDQLAQVGNDRDLGLVTAEYPHVAPWLPEPDRPAAVEEGKGATLLGLTTWSDGATDAAVLAWMQAHGQWIDWLASKDLRV